MDFALISTYIYIFLWWILIGNSNQHWVILHTGRDQSKDNKRMQCKQTSKTNKYICRKMTINESMNVLFDFFAKVHVSRSL